MEDNKWGKKPDKIKNIAKAMKKDGSTWEKATNKYRKEEPSERLFHEENIPSASYDSGYKAILKFNRFKGLNELIIRNGVKEAEILVEGIEETAGYIVIDNLKDDKYVADFVYHNKKGLKNVKSDDLLEEVKKGYKTVDLHERTKRILNDGAGELEIEETDENSLRKTRKTIRQDTSFPGEIDYESPMYNEEIEEAELVEENPALEKIVDEEEPEDPFKNIE
ncbi:hypothetical protein GF361_03250 [Candidatus Woesearchaeota archaeon]|nr:hypothetical protein [Candidatus Woesearchaeota archaeon]